MGVIEVMQEYRTPKRKWNMQWKLGSIGIYMAWD